ncbi:MAG: zf-HC2 domain-containing protein [Thermodesulfobacteriota bacterium]
MNCEKFEELLIDFIEGVIEPSDIELVKKHIATCQNCCKKLDEFKEIKKVYNGDTHPEPSPEVLTRLSRIAREELEKDNAPFWRKWFYSPILVPVLSTGLALGIWISYGQKDVGYGPDDTIYSTKVMAKKIPMAQEPDFPGVREEAVSNLESNQGPSLFEEPGSAPYLASGKKSRMEEGTTARFGEPAPGKEMIARRDIKEDDKYSRHRDEVSDKLEARAIREPASAPKIESEEGAFEVGSLSHGRSGETKEQRSQEVRRKSNIPTSYTYVETTYKDKLDLGLRQQKEGNCEASIKTNEELLNLAPPPTDPVKGKAYLSLGECYEQLGEWDKAVSNYKNLKKISPEQTAFAVKKIEYIKRQTRILKK